MSSRRQFLQSGIMISVGLTAGLPAAARPAAKGAAAAPLTLRRFFYDPQYAPGRAAAEVLASAGAELAPVVDDDAAPLCVDALWARPASVTAVAGLTRADTFFILRTYAADHGYRLAWSSEPSSPTKARSAMAAVLGQRKSKSVDLAALSPDFARVLAAQPLLQSAKPESELVAWILVNSGRNSLRRQPPARRTA